MIELAESHQIFAPTLLTLIVKIFTTEVRRETHDKYLKNITFPAFICAPLWLKIPLNAFSRVRALGEANTVNHLRSFENTMQFEAILNINENASPKGEF